MSTPAGVQVPAGTTNERPTVGNRYKTDNVGDLSGMIRYNITTGEFEGNQAGSWRSFRFKEPTQIIVQELGIGDFVETMFGPLDPLPPTTVQSGTTWTGANILVVVENVIQIFNTNYVTIENPARVIGSIIAFSSTGNTITSSNTGDGGIDFLKLGFRSGQKITVSGSGSNNGVYTIDTVSAGQITVLSELVTEPEGASITITGTYNLGTYIVFDQPVPTGKAVNVIHGFDK